MAAQVRAAIVVSQATVPPPGGYVSGSRDNLVLAQLITATNLDDAGVIGWKWTLNGVPLVSYGAAGDESGTFTLTPPASVGYGDIGLTLTVFGDPLDGTGGRNSATAHVLLGVRFNPGGIYAPGMPIPSPTESATATIDGRPIAPVSFDPRQGIFGRVREMGLAIAAFIAAGAATVLAGDVTGPSAANTVTKIQGQAWDGAAPTFGDVPVWDGAMWQHAAPSGGGVPLGGANQVYWSNSATNSWTGTPILTAIKDAGAHPASAGVLRTSNNVLSVQARNVGNTDDILLVGSGSDDKVYIGDGGAAGVIAQVVGTGSYVLKHGTRSTLSITRSTEAVGFAVDSIATSVAFSQPSTTASAGASWSISAQQSTHASGQGGDLTFNAAPGISRGGSIFAKCGTGALPGHFEVWIDGSIQLTVKSDGTTKVQSLAGLITGTVGVLGAIDGSQGDIAYRGASGWSILTAGTSGQYLKTLGAGANPAWATVSGGSFTAPSGTGLIHVTSGTMDGASSIGTGDTVMVTNAGATDTVWALLANANISGSAAIAVTKVALGGANQVLWSDGATNAWTTTPIVAAVKGTGTVASTGVLRVANNVGSLYARNAANSGDLRCVATDNSDRVVIGDTSNTVEVLLAINSQVIGLAGIPVPAGLGTTNYGIYHSWVDTLHRIGGSIAPASGTNKAGTHLRFMGGQPTGSASGGNVEVYLATTAGGSGTSITALDTTPVLACVYNSGANRVGILTSSPAATLDVNGATKTTSLTVSGLTTDGVVKVSGGAGATSSGLVVNADVSASAAIVLSKIVNPTGTGLVKATSGVFDAATSLLVNADVNAAAAIAVTKLALGSASTVLSSDGATNSFSSNPILAAISSTGTPATSGFVRTANNTTAVAARNAANGGNLALLGSNASDQPTLPLLTTNGLVKVSGGTGALTSATLVNADVDAAAAINITKIAVTSQAQGDVLYFDGTSWARLAAGTSGRFLQTLGAGANPAWAVAGGSAAPTGTGLVHITAGTQDGASSIGAANQVMVTNSGATDTVWATIVNANISSSAAIALSKIVNPTGTGLVKATSGAIDAATSLLVNADVSSSAAIVLSKIVNPTGTGIVKCTAGVFDAATSLILNADITTATIAIAKLVVGLEGQSITCRGGTTPVYSENSGTLLATGTVSLVHNSGVTTDTTLYTSPSSTNAIIEKVLLVLTTAQTGASSSSAITVGTSAGGTDLLTSWTVTTATTKDTVRGNDPTTLGTALDPTKSYVLEVNTTTAKSVSLRQVVSVANVTAGILTYYVYGTILR